MTPPFKKCKGPLRDCYGTRISPCDTLTTISNLRIQGENSSFIKLKDPKNPLKGYRLDFAVGQGLKITSDGLDVNLATVCNYVKTNCPPEVEPEPEPEPNPQPPNPPNPPNPNPDPNPNPEPEPNPDPPNPPDPDPNPNPDPDPEPTPSYPILSGTLRLNLNDLDFQMYPTQYSSQVEAIRFKATVNSANFFQSGGNHIVFGVTPKGGQGSNNPHCGPVIRNGVNLWSLARGFIVYGDGTIKAEFWNGTASPGIADVGFFDRATYPIFTMVITAGFRSGPYAETMAFKIHAGASDSGLLIAEGSVPWGWEWTGDYGAGLGAIGNTFQGPTPPTCVEPVRAGANGYVPFSGMTIELVG